MSEVEDHLEDHLRRAAKKFEDADSRGCFLALVAAIREVSKRLDAEPSFFEARAVRKETKTE